VSLQPLGPGTWEQARVPHERGAAEPGKDAGRNMRISRQIATWTGQSCLPAGVGSPYPSGQGRLDLPLAAGLNAPGGFERLAAAVLASLRDLTGGALGRQLGLQCGALLPTGPGPTILRSLSLCDLLSLRPQLRWPNLQVRAERVHPRASRPYIDIELQASARR
jgi:hypothetical protein